MGEDFVRKMPYSGDRNGIKNLGGCTVFRFFPRTVKLAYNAQKPH